MRNTTFKLVVYFCFEIADITVTICENKGPKEISCATGEAISITSAFYGRTRPDSEICPYEQDHQDRTDCVAEGSEAKIRTMCDGKISCSIPSNNAVYGDPCFLTYKYVSVTYRCVHVGKACVN